MDLLRQIGQLFLQAVPTAIIVLFFYFVLSWSFFKPIGKVLAERKARMEGARRDAESLARGRGREAPRPPGWIAQGAHSDFHRTGSRPPNIPERAQHGHSAGTRQCQRTGPSGKKNRIAAELEAARGELEDSGKALAEQIVRAILDKAQLSPDSAGRVQ